MKSIHSNKALVLGGLLLVSLAAVCAGDPEWSNNRFGNSGGGFKSAYPNLDGSAGSYPYNSVYARSSPDKRDYQTYLLYNDSGDNHYASGHGNRGREQEPYAAEGGADLGRDRSAKAEKYPAQVYR